MKYIYIILFTIWGISFLQAEVKVELSKLSIDFGEVPYCKKVTDTIVVKNSSTSTGNLKLLVGEKIIGQDSKNFRITNPKIKDLDLPPYDGTNSVIYVVEFDATIQPFGNKIAKLLIPNDSKDTLIEIPITAKSTIVEYEISPNVLDFQDISINQDYYADLDITIKSNLNGKIATFFWTEPTNLDVDTTGSSVLISNTKRTYPVKIRLNKLGEFNAMIEVRISEPCDTVFKIPVKANAPNGFLQGFRPVDLGLVSACESVEEVIEITFNGFGSGTINSFEIEGDGKENIAVSFDNALPATFSKNGDKTTCKIQYNGNSKNYGKKQIIIKFNTEINSESKQYTMAVDYELAEVILIASSSLVNFPNTYPNQTNYQSIEISNNSPFDIVIDKIDLICTYNLEFSIQPNSTPITINKSDKKDFQIGFNPQLQNTDYTCKLEISYSSNGCSDTLYVDLSGKSLSKANLQMSFGNLNNLEIAPKANSISIPISISTTEGEITLNDTLEFEIMFPRSIFFYNNTISTNTILEDNKIINQNRHLTFQTVMNDYKVTTQKTTFATLEGVPLLGDIVDGEFSFATYKFLSQSKSYEISQAISLPFKLITCNEGEARLLSFTDQNTPIIEIKYTDMLNIDININAIESGLYKILLYDITGNMLIEQTLYANSKQSYNVQIERNNYPNGFYFLIIKTPSEIYSNKILIYK